MICPYCGDEYFGDPSVWDNDLGHCEARDCSWLYDTKKRAAELTYYDWIAGYSNKHAEEIDRLLRQAETLEKTIKRKR